MQTPSHQSDTIVRGMANNLVRQSARFSWPSCHVLSFFFARAFPNRVLWCSTMPFIRLPPVHKCLVSTVLSLTSGCGYRRCGALPEQQIRFAASRRAQLDVARWLGGFARHPATTRATNAITLQLAARRQGRCARLRPCLHNCCACSKHSEPSRRRRYCPEREQCQATTWLPTPLCQNCRFHDVTPRRRVEKRPITMLLRWQLRPMFRKSRCCNSRPTFLKSCQR